MAKFKKEAWMSRELTPKRIDILNMSFQGKTEFKPNKLLRTLEDFLPLCSCKKNPFLINKRDFFNEKQITQIEKKQQQKNSKN